MTDYLYCITTPANPGIIQIERSMIDPRILAVDGLGRSLPGRIEWVLPVADGDAAHAALCEALKRHAEPGHAHYFRCDATRARSAASQFASLSSDVRTESETPEVRPLPVVQIMVVMVLCLGIHFLGIATGNTLLSFALVAAALFVVVAIWARREPA